MIHSKTAPNQQFNPVQSKEKSASANEVEAPSQAYADYPATAQQSPSLGSWPVQTKVAIGAKDDPYEQEADAMADQVVSQRKQAEGIDEGDGGDEAIQRKSLNPILPVSTIQRMPSGNGGGCNCPECSGAVQKKAMESVPRVQRKEETEEIEPSDSMATPVQRQAAHQGECNCPECSGAVQKKAMETVPRVQRKAEGDEASPHDNLESRLNASKGGGTSLSPAVQAKMEQGFGADFGNVNIHNNSEAAQLSNDMGAKAFTHGNDVYFNEGQYNPESESGQHLLAHELTHTIQQGAVQQKADTPVQRKAKPAVQKKSAPVVQRAEGDTSYYYATDSAAHMRVKTADNKFPYMNNGTVKNGGATILDPDNEFNPQRRRRKYRSCGNCRNLVC